ncbi:MAG: ABC transporter substrate-binding protein [Miltoncostaeaceae bacterium]
MKRNRMMVLAAVGVLGIGGVVAGCGDDDEEGGDVGDLNVGVLVPLTGDLSPFGGPGSQAANLAADQANAAATAAGVELNLTLTEEDTKTDPQAAQEAATKLIESDGVDAIAGPWASSETIPTAENVTIDAGIPLVSPSATSPDVTGLDDDGTVSRTAPSDALQGQVIAQAMAQEFGADATVVTANRNDAYGSALVAEFTKAWEAGGGTVARNVAYNPEAASLNSEAQQIVQGNPDAWMIIDFPDSWQKMGPALVRTGDWDPARTFSADGLRSNDLPDQAGNESTEGMRGTAPTSLEAPAGQAFDDLWKAEIGEERQTFDAQNFDAVVLLALASVAAGSNDPSDIAGEVVSVSGPPGNKYTFEQLDEAFTAAANGDDVDYEGASGPLDLDDNGDPAASNYALWSYDDGALVDSDEVISFSNGTEETSEDGDAAEDTE